MIFKMNECDFGFKFNTLDYEFTHVMNLAIEDPEFNRLTRGSNAGNKTGIAYKEGNKDPKQWTVTILDMTIEIKNLLDQIFEDQSRLDVYCVSRKDGSSKMAKDAILCQRPQQLNLDENPESLQVALIFQTFDSAETMKT